MSENEKPPLGLLPEYLWRENRIDEIVQAMSRVRGANKPIPQDWIEELKQHEMHLASRAQRKSDIVNVMKNLARI